MLYAIHNIPIGNPSILYILVFFCHIEYVYNIVAKTDNRLKNPSYVNTVDPNDIRYSTANITISFFDISSLFYIFLLSTQLFRYQKCLFKFM